jgi:aminoglycoside 6'-N-acetyltransferase
MLIADETLTLRRLCAQDWEAFQSYRLDPFVGTYQSWNAMTDAEAKAFMREMECAPIFAPGMWSQIAVEADGLIGDIGLRLHESGEEVEIGVTLARGAQGLGYGPRVARLAAQLIWRDTAAKRIRAICDVRNSAPLKLLERSAFEEGLPRLSDGVAERQFTLPRPSLP